MADDNTPPPPLSFVCKRCGGESFSELARWVRWYTLGESFVEHCPHCGAAYSVRIVATRRKELEGQPYFGPDARYNHRKE